MRYTVNDAFGDVRFNFNLYCMHRNKNIPRTMYATITNVYNHTLRLRDAILPFNYKWKTA